MKRKKSIPKIDFVKIDKVELTASGTNVTLNHKAKDVFYPIPGVTFSNNMMHFYREWEWQRAMRLISMYFVREGIRAEFQVGYAEEWECTGSFTKFKYKLLRKGKITPSTNPKNGSTCGGVHKAKLVNEFPLWVDLSHRDYKKSHGEYVSP